MRDVDVIVVGAGVVGLAVARSLAHERREVWVLESGVRAGEGVSSRNSGVIHAGIHYPPGSLKARLCGRGRDLLYDYCARRGVPCRRIGKLLVATDDGQRARLRQLLDRGIGNGVPELRWLERADALRLEPELTCVAAVSSPQTGIVDVPELVMALVGELESVGGRLACRNEVRGVRVESQAFRVELVSGDVLYCRMLVNAAGLGSSALASRIDGLGAAFVPSLYYGAGHYYTIRGHCPFERLIYPLPEPGGLGIHLCMDLSGHPRFGPDMRWVDAPNYRFDDSQRARFASSIRLWWPAVEADDLLPDFVGIRPKLSKLGEADSDFVIQDADVHGINGLVNLFGIESPGLTSCLAIGEEVAHRLCV